MKFIYLGFLIILSTEIWAQNPTAFNPEKKYHPDTVKLWTRGIMNELALKHPGFYRYTSPEKFNFLIDSTLNTVVDSLTELEHYRKIKPLFAQIGCLHTGVSLSEEYYDHLNRSPNLLPLEVFIDENKRVFVTKNHSSDTTISLKGEILSINEKPIEEILNTLFRAIPSDGYNQTEKVLTLNHRFPFWYQTMIDTNTHFRVEIKENERVTIHQLTGVNNNVFPSMESLEQNYKKPLEFDTANNVGILKIHSFAKTVIKDSEQNFRRFIESTFVLLNEQKIENLIIDLRYNSGGTDANAAFLASYFFDRPFRYWEKIEVTEALAKEVKGLARFIYRKPIKKDSSYHWQKSLFINEFDFYEIQKPAKNNYKGRVYIITNGLCMSSCSDFVAILSHHHKAKIVGQESGGGYQGNTSGIIPTTKISSGLSITIPLQKYTTAVDLSKNFGHGTIPDYPVNPTLNDWIYKRDVEMEFLIKLIQNK